ncbi:MAG: bacteriohemerythrin [Pseudomonadota bacterium]
MVDNVEIFPWNENFATGIALIDEQHRKLVGLINKLVSHLAYQSDAPSLNAVFEELKDYTEVHFSTEMAIWRAHFEGDSWQKWHDHAHDDFIGSVLKIKATEATRPFDDVIEEIVRFLTHWLAYHILEADKRMAKVVLALPSGMSLAKAKEMANDEMAGSTKVLIDTVMTMYDQLANRTVQLTREINRRKQAEAELLEARIKADAANAAKSTFLANISHEIRTPLNAITGMVYLLRREGLPPHQMTRLGHIDHASKLLLGIINDVLDLSKIEAGKMVLQEAPLALESVVSGVVSILSDRVAEKRLRLEVHKDTLPRNLLGDYTSLQQVLLNLATNAVKFTDAGTVTLRVHVSEETDLDALVRFEVQDTGMGIEPDQLERLFRPFEQADNSRTRQHGGTGLGLAIVARLTELMGGTCGAESTPGKGSLFWFTARLKKTDVEAASSMALSAEEAKDRMKPWAGSRVLVVDDEPVNQEISRLFLEDVGLSVDCAGNGAQALERVADGDYALVFMDMQMPVLSGLEATRRIRALPAGRDVPIIAMTANAFDEDRRLCLEAGMDDFLGKPLLPEVLYALVLKWLSRNAG